MSISQTFARRMSAVAVAGSLLAAASVAQAGVIAAFDPVFGGIYPQLGFKGNVTFDVTDACYSMGSGLLATGGACAITATVGEVDFYASADLTRTTVPNIVSLTPSSFPTGYVTSFFLDALSGQITGFNTLDSNIFGVSVPSLGVTTSMVLYFTTSTPILIAGISAAPAATIPGVGGAFLRNCSSIDEGGACLSDTGDTSNRATLTVTRIPEPDSVALAMLGLGALALTRRRNKSKA